MHSNPAQSIELKRRIHAQALDAAVESIVLKAGQMPEIERIILFGSYASGRRDLFTDLDLIVVMVSEIDFIYRTADLYTKLHTRVDMDLLVYTPEEWENNQENRFIRRALQTGKVIYEKKRS